MSPFPVTFGDSISASCNAARLQRVVCQQQQNLLWQSVRSAGLMSMLTTITQSICLIHIVFWMVYLVFCD